MEQVISEMSLEHCIGSESEGGSAHKTTLRGTQNQLKERPPLAKGETIGETK